MRKYLFAGGYSRTTILAPIGDAGIAAPPTTAKEQLPGSSAIPSPATPSGRTTIAQFRRALPPQDIIRYRANFPNLRPNSQVGSKIE